MRHSRVLVHEEQSVNMSLLETNIKEMQKMCEDPLLLLSLLSIIVIIALHVFSRLLNWGGGGLQKH